GILVVARCSDSYIREVLQVVVAVCSKIHTCDGNDEDRDAEIIEDAIGFADHITAKRNHPSIWIFAGVWFTIRDEQDGFGAPIREALERFRRGAERFGGRRLRF